MCGVFGFCYSKEHAPDAATRAIIATLLAEEMQTRGRDASGYASYSEGEKAIMFNKTDRPYMASGLLPTTANALTLIGHTRFATVGAKTRENAHPWHIGKLVGAHNGGIYNHMEMRKKYADRKEYDVDSMHLIRHINDELDTTELTGYGTVEWMDTRDLGAVYLCAMNRGDLEIEALPDGAGVVWASTREAIRVAMSAVGLWTKSKSLRAEQGIVYRVFNGEIVATERRLALGAPYTHYSSKGSHHTGKYAAASSVPTSDEWRDGWKQGEDGIWRKRGEVSTTSEPSTKTEGNARAIKEYNDAAESLLKATDKMTRRRRRRFEKLLEQSEYHADMCSCSVCREIMQLATEAIVGTVVAS